MKIHFVLSLLLIAAPVFAEPKPGAGATDSSGKSPAHWSVTGDWLGKHPNWRDTIAIRPDGTFSRSKGGGGKWELSMKDDHVTLRLNWEAWNPEELQMVTPEHFRGSTRTGRLELRRSTTDAAASAQPDVQPAPEFDQPELKARLRDSVWQFRDGKEFTLHADGSTSGNWHDRKGFWRIVAPNRVQLAVMWRAQAPVTVAVEAGETLLRWSDADWGQLAKRVEPEPAQP